MGAMCACCPPALICCLSCQPPLLQLLAEHPRLAASDSSTLVQLAEALGVAQQQLPLLLRAAERALAGGDMQRAQGLLLALAAQRYT